MPRDEGKMKFHPRLDDNWKEYLVNTAIARQCSDTFIQAKREIAKSRFAGIPFVSTVDI